MGCDVIAARTDHGTIFAKNSDRPAYECQPLFHAPYRAYGPAATVRCQYLEIAQRRRPSRFSAAAPGGCGGSSTE